MLSCILNFLPQSPDSLLKNKQAKINALLLLRGLVEEAIKSLEYFLNKKFNLFDPHVGETACQIRAYKLSLLGSKSLKNFFILKADLKKLKKFYSKIDKLVNSVDPHESFSQKHEGLYSFFKKSCGTSKISQKTHFIFLCYFLTFFKENQDDNLTFISHEKICNHFSISRKLSRKIVHNYQVKLSEDSVNFICELSKKIPEFKSQKKLFEILEKRDDDNRASLPCYLVQKVLLTDMVTSGTPILLEIENTQKSYIFVSSEGSKEKYELLNSQNHLLKSLASPPIVIKTSSQSSINLNHVLSLYGLEELIMANMTLHPQYPGLKLKKFNSEPFESPKDLLKQTNNEFQVRKKFALEKLQAEESPKLFFIKHIFCGNMLELKKHKKRKYLEAFPLYN